MWSVRCKGYTGYTLHPIRSARTCLVQFHVGPETDKTAWSRWDLNPQSLVCHTSALPLCYDPEVGTAGFEPATDALSVHCSDQTELRSLVLLTTLHPTGPRVNSSSLRNLLDMPPRCGHKVHHNLDKVSSHRR